MEIVDLKIAIDHYIAVLKNTSNNRVKPILLFNKEKFTYEVSFLNPVYVENFMSKKYNIIKKTL